MDLRQLLLSGGEHALYMRSEQAAEDYVDERVDGSGCRLHVDKVLSVSALPEPEHVFVQEVINEQEARFLHPWQEEAGDQPAEAFA